MTQHRIHFDDLILADDQSTHWQGRPFTGTAYETNARGVVIEVLPFVDGLEQGVAREWSDSGQLKAESARAFGSRHGVTRTWHDNGQLESEGDYRYSVKVRERRFARDGALLEEWTLPEDDRRRELIAEMEKRFGAG
jgi:antitoxin component YwqK of YwqJK toxin-antitoxin module